MKNAKNLIRWHGIIAMLDTPDPWQRVISTEQFTWTLLDIPLRDAITGHRYDGSTLVGSVNNIYISDKEVHGAGWIDKTTPSGRLIEAREHLAVGADIHPIITQQKLMALTIIDNPSWPQCRISKVI